MKVLLIKDVNKLGKAGEIKEVKDGYGKNFLVAKGFAKHATDEVIEQWKIEQARLEKELQTQIDAAQKLKEVLESSQFTVKHKVGANGHLIGSVTNKEIAQVLASEGVDIDKKQIHLEHKITMPGIFEVECKLGHGVSALAKIDVIEL